MIRAVIYPSVPSSLVQLSAELFSTESHSPAQLPLEFHVTTRSAFENQDSVVQNVSRCLVVPSTNVNI